MKAVQILKVALVVAIVFALAKLLGRGGRWGGNRWTVQPYEFERFDDADYEASLGDADYEDAEDADYEDAEDDYEDDYEDEDAEDAEDAEDEEYEDDAVEGFANRASPADGGLTGGLTGGLLSAAPDLLPKPTYATQDFAEFAPKSLLGQNFLDAKKYVGENTQGSSLRNANYDLRSAPAIPRRNIGPWMQSTIDADLYRKPLEG